MQRWAILFEEPSCSRVQYQIAFEPQAGASSVPNDIQYRWLNRNREAVIVLVLTVLAFAVRVYRIDFNSLSEDESAKWAAVQEYRNGHFAGVNSEHPMLPKVLAWASLSAGERWDRIAHRHSWPSLLPEGWLRLPNVLFGALSAAFLYLLCRRMMGIAGSFAASFFWAVAPLPIALNRLMKEETPLTFFTLLACYLYCRAQQAQEEQSARRWYDLSAVSFGLALASQYILHLLGLNALVWLIAGKMGLNLKPSQFSYRRFFFVLFLAFVLVNPVVLSPGNLHAILQWLHHGGIKHTGYDFDGTLYMNFPSRLFTGVPWFYYLWLLLVKTPIPIMVAVIVGIIMLMRDRQTLAFCFFVSLGMVQLIGLSVSGAKWIRYSLPLLPFLYLAGGYAVQHLWTTMKERGSSRVLARMAVLILFGWPLVESQAWAPYYPFYLNAIGGGTRNITRYFAPDEVSEFDTREVAEEVCPVAPRGSKLATARPMSMVHYLQTCGRGDMDVVPLYDPHYVPQDGDLIILEPSRRFFETQRFFDVLESSDMSHRQIRVGPVLASTIYRFDTSSQAARSLEEDSTITQLHEVPFRFAGEAQELNSRNTSHALTSQISRRRTQ
jgi:Dolichyl-phosphate-mannose-protein mannosyltransferase